MVPDPGTRGLAAAHPEARSELVKQRSVQFMVATAVYLLTVGVAVGISYLAVGNWMPGLPLGVIVGILASSATVALWKRRQRDRSPH